MQEHTTRRLGMAEKPKRKLTKGAKTIAGSAGAGALSRERRPKAREVLKRSDHERRKAFQGERKRAE
jgi:hypothetical protein